VENGAEPYYFNSETDSSRWDRPPELDTVLAAMKTWYTTPQQPQASTQPPVSTRDAAERAAMDGHGAHTLVDLDEEADDFVYTVRFQ
jgi:hypothetical protein